METEQTKLQHNFFLFLLIAVLVVMFYILRPFLAPLILALSFSVIFRSPYNYILKMVGGYRSIASGLTILLLVIVVFLPLIFIGSLLFAEAQSLYSAVATNGVGLGTFNSSGTEIQHYIHRLAPTVTFDIRTYIQYGLQWGIGHLDTFFSGFLKIVLELFIMVIALFYLFKDGTSLRKKFISLSPLSNKYDEQILSKLTIVINSVLKGSLVIGVIQGILAALGAWMFGLPNPVIWGVCATIASFIPGIGTSIVVIPGILYLFVLHHIGQSLGLLFWQFIVVGLIDNLLSPYLFGRGIHVHSFFVLLSVLGGLALFGPIGFILGPIMLALLLVLLDIYPLILNK